VRSDLQTPCRFKVRGAGARHARPASATLPRTSTPSRRRQRAISSSCRPRTSMTPNWFSSVPDQSLPGRGAGGSSAISAPCGSTILRCQSAEREPPVRNAWLAQEGADFHIRYLAPGRRIRVMPDEGQARLRVASEEPSVTVWAAIQSPRLCVLHSWLTAENRLCRLRSRLTALAFRIAIASAAPVRDPGQNHSDGKADIHVVG
jgi:hypothetical protein